MGACLSIEEGSYPSKRAPRRNQSYSRPANKKTTNHVPSSKKRTNSYEQSIHTKQYHLSKAIPVNDDLHRLKSTTTRRSTSKPRAAHSTKDIPVLREVNRGSNLQQYSTHDDLKEKDSKNASQETKQLVEQYRHPHYPKAEETSSLAAPWASGSLVQQRMSQLLQNNSLKMEHEPQRENVSWSGLVKQRQSIFQSNIPSSLETMHKKDIQPKEEESKWKESDQMKKNSSMKENATPRIELSAQSIEPHHLKKTVETSTEWKQRLETSNQQYHQRIPRKKIEETSSEMHGNDSLDIEKWRNRRTRRMARNSVLMEEQEDPEEAAARSMRGSVLRAHSSMKFQF
ncbi:hypothetical protein Gasu2_68400 [Galdieria sulphuraria]|uniref:Uncharacterized protein n=1 Tax=Galdieria sulphuraria TaxID=130081 RepID=M2W1T1_GALSU|nr:uncharacterized protein Gasu_30720 [Galdieria sulphuraria]EME29636.1 hypothetical protein Gasu_30720 [Galdieria sulphuraria]GJD12768.1 hypothetical protein Gasu2_68400 [Galdieria sulphuraria]|eukprot:XP_005706156.1 hypothetical protein Gasu_30720 [Galdieria sulphuraria]